MSRPNPVREETTTTRRSPESAHVFEVLERTLAYARGRSYTGWDYGDGMSSQLRQSLPFDSKWVNVAFQEAVKRVPLNVRPLLLVEQRRSYQGAALFAMANQTAAQFGTSPASEAEPSYDVDYDEEARSLADWLVDRSTAGYSGYCAGLQHPIQHLDGRGEAREPDIVNTSFGAKALLRAGAYEESYPAAVRDAPRFVLEDLHYRQADSGRGAVIDYHTKHPQSYFTVNAGALCARLFVDLYACFGEGRLRELAEGLFDHIADLQTDRGGWMYRDPPSASHLSMDTHHNGFIIQCFQRYREVFGDDRYDETVSTALPFFQETLFDPDGAPRFDEQTTYPRDINAAAQGILVFSKAGDLAFARRILAWVFENLHAGGGQFYFQRERFYTRRVTLMRWCQAWMAFAMSEFLAARSGVSSP